MQAMLMGWLMCLSLFAASAGESSGKIVIPGGAKPLPKPRNIPFSIKGKFVLPGERVDLLFTVPTPDRRVIVSGSAHTSTAHGVIQAIDASGETLWELPTTTEQPILVDRDGSVYIAVSGNYGDILACNSDGTAKWDGKYTDRKSYDSICNVALPMILQEGVLYVARKDRSVEALRTSDGSRLWRCVSKKPFLDMVVNHRNNVVLLDESSNLIEIDESGVVVSSIEVDPDRWYYSNDGRIILGSDGMTYVWRESSKGCRLYCIAGNGEIVWNVPSDFPAVIDRDGAIYTWLNTSQYRRLYISKLTPDGKEQWRKKIPADRDPDSDKNTWSSFPFINNEEKLFFFHLESMFTVDSDGEIQQSPGLTHFGSARHTQSFITRVQPIIYDDGDIDLLLSERTARDRLDLVQLKTPILGMSLNAVWPGVYGDRHNGKSISYTEYSRSGKRLTWDAIDGASKYHVRIVDSGNNTVIDKDDCTDTAFLLPNDMPEGNYTFVVRAGDDDEWGEWSVSRPVILAAKPVLGFLSFGCDYSAPEARAEFHWRTRDGIATEGYEYLLRDTAGNTVMEGIGLVPFLRLGKPLSAGTYVMAVRPKLHRDQGEWAELPFWIGSYPDNLAVLNRNSDKPTFKWDPVSEATGYVVEMQSGKSGEVIFRERVKTNEYTVAFKPAKGERYAWRVATENKFGIGEFSPLVKYTFLGIPKTSIETALSRKALNRN